MFYKQCKLQRKNIQTVAYIPSEFAKVGKVVQIKQEDGSWDDGWTVLSASEAVPAKTVERGETAHKAFKY